MKSKNNIKTIKEKLRKRLTKNPLRWIIGGFFIFLGIIGALLPILQGWFFFIIGLAILFEENIIQKIKQFRKEGVNRRKKVFKQKT